MRTVQLLFRLPRGSTARSIRERVEFIKLACLYSGLRTAYYRVVLVPQPQTQAISLCFSGGKVRAIGAVPLSSAKTCCRDPTNI